MLERIAIHNFGLIDTLEIEFCRGLNILTGSTGAGKSIIIDGLRFVLGERLHQAQVRDIQKPCQVEAVFSVSPTLFQVAPSLQDFSPEEDGTLIISRQTSPEGRAKIKVNGVSVTISQLKDIGRCLIDLHGPHDHQMLLSEDSHQVILDQLTDFGGVKEQYERTFREYSSLKARLSELQQLAESRTRDCDRLASQLEDLNAVALDDAVYEKVCQDLTRVTNAEKLYENAAMLVDLFENEAFGIDMVLRRGFGPLRILTHWDETTRPFERGFSQLQENSGQLLADLKAYADSLSFEPTQAESVKNLYDIYESLKRKYGPSLADVRNYYQKIQSQYQDLMDWEHNDREIRQQLQKTEKHLSALAGQCTECRKKSAQRLKTVVERELKDLGMSHVAFEVRLSERGFLPRGVDEVAFYISPNIGEPCKPLAQIISSGEAARVMLALKRALMDVDPVPVLIFDEIDAQIGGRLGAVIGQKLKVLSRHRQIILITHLPQIAAFADRHFRVLKQVQDGRAVTRINILEQETRIEELAHMMSGDKKGDIAVRHARVLLAEAQEAAP
ncbi:MAG TPA: DNA repair protein RecN [Candidatus Omnitrophota bacterium]|nr:DNA repair protein RecN [Candidatus Omnitrophota bacterium]HQO57884.1 DNA repair protein RecN [Candidatus Omnitrophota bacterium]